MDSWMQNKIETETRIGFTQKSGEKFYANYFNKRNGQRWGHCYHINPRGYATEAEAVAAVKAKLNIKE